MMVMTAKVDLKKIALILGGIVVLILLLLTLFGGGESSAPTAATPVSGNDARVKFLTDFGWDVASNPVESGQVRVPEQASPVYDRYNALQKEQGYDLTAYAGKNVMRYVYKVNNYPGATEPVYATLLVYKNQVIGGDITDTAAKGKIRGFRMPESATDPGTTQNTVPSTATS